MQDYKNTIFKLLLGHSLTLFFAGCGNKKTLKNPQPVTEASAGFDQILNEVLADNCPTCHATYNNYDLTAPQENKILQAVQSGRMPKG